MEGIDPADGIGSRNTAPRAGSRDRLRCWLCDDLAVVYGSFGLKDMGLCEPDLAEVFRAWRMHAGADGMHLWADRSGVWHPARQYYGPDDVAALRSG